MCIDRTAPKHYGGGIWVQLDKETTSFPFSIFWRINLKIKPLN
jgi:hypothetical protein